MNSKKQLKLSFFSATAMILFFGVAQGALGTSLTCEETLQGKTGTPSLRIDGTRLVFHRIEPGTFTMGDAYPASEGERASKARSMEMLLLKGAMSRQGTQEDPWRKKVLEEMAISPTPQVNVTLTKPFAMSATETTQIVWKRVVQLIKGKLKDQRFTALREDPSFFKGDTHPVERVSFEDVQTWIEGLNVLSQSGEPVLEELIQGHQMGDVYRLPTEAEWEFVVRGRGAHQGNYHFGNEVGKLGDHAWYADNAGDSTHPVAQKLPLLIDGQEFYDLHGNVNERVYDPWSLELPGGIDPMAPRSAKSAGRPRPSVINLPFHTHRGGSFENFDFSLYCASRGADLWNEKDLGFRLVKTLSQ